MSRLKEIGMENRKQVPGYPNYYVEPEGRVFSVRKNGYLTPFRSSRGILTVQLGTNIGTTRQFQIHKLVGLVYLPNPNNYKHLIHKDGDKHNNNVNNLEWKRIHTSKINKLKKAQRVLKKPRKEDITQSKRGKRMGEPTNNEVIKDIKDIKDENIKDIGTAITDYPGYYVDRSGRVYSKHRNEYLKPNSSKASKQPSVTLFKTDNKGNKTSKVILIKRLVAEAYIDNPLNLPFVIQLDGDKSNNSVDNLKWSDTK